MKRGTLPLNALRTFACVCSHGGVRAAARELGVSHSAVSRQIHVLERWLDVKLIRQDARALSVTPQGRQLGQAVHAALAAIDRSVDAIREQRSKFAVVVSTTPSFATRWLLPRLPRLQRAHPRLEVSVVVDQRIESPEVMRSDLLIRTGPGPWHGVDAQPWMDERLYPVASPHYWEHRARPENVASLRHATLLHDRDPNASWSLWRARFGPADLDVRSGPRFASTDLVLRAAATGMGVALAHHRLVTEDLASGALVRLFGAERQVDLGNRYWLIVPPHAEPNEAVQQVISWLRREGSIQDAETS